MCSASARPMTNSPIARRVRRHRRGASYRALRGIQNYSPICDWERRNQRNQISRKRHRRVSRALLGQMLNFFGIPKSPPRQRRQPQPEPDPDMAIVISSDSSSDNLPQPEPHIVPLLIEMSSSSEEDLPDIEQLEVQPPPQLLQVELLQEPIILLEEVVFLRRLSENYAEPLRPVQQPPINWDELELRLATIHAVSIGHRDNPH